MIISAIKSKDISDKRSVLHPETIKNLISKGIEIISLDLKKIESAICKYFIICTGTSNTHTKSIENKIRKVISKDLEEKPLHIEGNNTGEWILMDYVDIVIHIFQKNIRDFYNIESLWGDAQQISFK